MKDLVIPPNEDERLEALRRYEILDTPPDGSFNRVTAIAASLFKVPIALVTLVDEDRIWFKSKFGLEVEQINRDPGLCASAILSDDVYNIADTLKDPRTLSNPLVAGDFGLRFYAAAPLRTFDGYNLGTLCLLDKKPWELTAEEEGLLKELAGIIMDEMELRISALNATRKLRKNKLNLEKEVERRTSDLVKTNKELTRTNHELEQFAYISSHDLKEPLRMVTVYAQLFQERYKDTFDEEGMMYLNYMIEGAQRMRHLINDLMNYSKAGRIEFQKEPINMMELIEDVKNSLKKEIEENHVKIEVESLPNIHSYYTQFKLLYQNLIGNSIKFKNKGDVLIKIGAEKMNDEYRFYVTDNGIGIGKEFHRIIFNLFQRLHQPGKYPGTGIGLSICKKIIDQLNGKIWVDSEIDKGTTIYFTIPETELVPLNLSAVN